MSSGLNTPAPNADDTAAVQLALGKRVSETRRRRNLTGRDLAELADLTPGYISQLEHGQVTPSVGTLIRLGKALGMSLSSLFDAHEPAAGRVITREERKT